MNGREIDKLCYSRNEQKTEILLQEVIRKHPICLLYTSPGDLYCDGVPGG